MVCQNDTFKVQATDPKGSVHKRRTMVGKGGG